MKARWLAISQQPVQQNAYKNLHPAQWSFELGAFVAWFRLVRF